MGSDPLMSSSLDKGGPGPSGTATMPCGLSTDAGLQCVALARGDIADGDLRALRRHGRRGRSMCSSIGHIFVQVVSFQDFVRARDFRPEVEHIWLEVSQHVIGVDQSRSCIVHARMAQRRGVWREYVQRPCRIHVEYVLADKYSTRTLHVLYKLVEHQAGARTSSQPLVQRCSNAYKVLRRPPWRQKVLQIPLRPCAKHLKKACSGQLELNGQKVEDAIGKEKRLVDWGIGCISDWRQPSEGLARLSSEYLTRKRYDAKRHHRSASILVPIRHSLHAVLVPPMCCPCAAGRSFPRPRDHGRLVHVLPMSAPIATLFANLGQIGTNICPMWTNFGRNLAPLLAEDWQTFAMWSTYRCRPNADQIDKTCPGAGKTCPTNDYVWPEFSRFRAIFGRFRHRVGQMRVDLDQLTGYFGGARARNSPLLLDKFLSKI